MFTFNYTIIVNSSNKELFRPTEVHKIYSCIKVSDLKFNLNDLFYIKDLKSNNLYEQIVIDKKKDLIYIAPGIDIDSDFSIIQNNQEYLLSNKIYDQTISNKLIIGSLVVPNFNTRSFFNVRDNIRIIEEKNNIINMKYTKINNILYKSSLYLFNYPFIMIYFDYSDEIINFLHESQNIKVQSITSINKDVDIDLTIKCYGGQPKIKAIDRLVNPSYDLIIHNISDNIITRKEIFDFHIEKLQKKIYTIEILDSANNSANYINNIADNSAGITIDLTNLYTDISISPPIASNVNKLTNSIYELFN